MGCSQSQESGTARAQFRRICTQGMAIQNTLELLYSVNLEKAVGGRVTKEMYRMTE